jgi:thiol-disulfide isomerase/thioredoxin
MPVTPIKPAPKVEPVKPSPAIPVVIPRPTLIVFFATWCNPCQRAKPAVDRLEAAGVHVVRYDIDQHLDLVQKYGVASVPTFFLVRSDDKIVERTQDIQVVLIFYEPLLHSP